MPYTTANGLANGAVNTPTVTITNCDLSLVKPGMTISFGSRERKVGDSYIIDVVAIAGTTGGTLTLRGPLAVAQANQPFVIETFGGDVSATAVYTIAMTRFTGMIQSMLGVGYNFLVNDKVLVFDKPVSGALSALLFKITGSDKFRISQQAVGGVEKLLLEATADGTNWTTGLSISPDGSVTVGGTFSLPSRPAFFATLGFASRTIANGTVFSGFTTKTNIGNAFNGSRFTAPVAGTYLLSASLSLSSFDTGFFAIKINGAANNEIVVLSSSGWVNGGQSIIRTLAANDYVEFGCTNGTSQTVSSIVTFAGAQIA